MSDTGINRRLCLGWALSLFWPLAGAPLLLIPPLLEEFDVSALIVTIPVSVIAALAILVLIDLALRLLSSTPSSNEPSYPCPTCGNDIEHTPNCCPRCGSQLIWGFDPEPEDVRSFRGRCVEH